MCSPYFIFWGAEFFYVYYSDSNIVRSIDICAKEEYNYIYNEGTLIEAITYDIKLNRLPV